MKRLLTYAISVLLTVGATTANAQIYRKMSPHVRQLVMAYENTANAKAIMGENAEKTTKLIALVKGSDISVAKYCIRHQDDLHIVAIPIDEVAQLSEDDNIEAIVAEERPTHATLSTIATQSNVRDVWNGVSLPQCYDGSGVLAGIVDIGFDPTHPTFFSSDGELRIKRIWDYLDLPENQELPNISEKDLGDNPFPFGKLYTTKESIIEKRATADSIYTNHGTHTASILAGSGAGTLNIGMAPAADLYCVGTITSENHAALLSDQLYYVNTNALDLLAFQNIYDYADSLNKPCVISYSIASRGDITDYDYLINTYMERLTSNPGHIFVCSAGNNGTMCQYMPKSESVTSVGGLLRGESTMINGRYVRVHVSTQKTLTMTITDQSKDATKTRSKTFNLDFLPGNTKAKSAKGLAWYNYTVYDEIDGLDSLTVTFYSADDCFDTSRVGYDIDIELKNNDTFSSHPFTISFSGEKTEARIFCSYGEIVRATTYESGLYGAEKYGNVTFPGGLPCPITVGATNSGTICDFSGHGPSFHNLLTKPDVVAQGYRVTAANNRYYDHSKEWTLMNGTSMSTPAVAGIIALWLQANPSLTQENVRNIIRETAQQRNTSLTYPNNIYGYGEIDAYKGLLMALKFTAISELPTEHLTNATVRPDGNGNITVTFHDTTTTPLPLRVYSVSGIMLYDGIIPAGTSSYTIHVNAKGITAVQVGRQSTVVNL